MAIPFVKTLMRAPLSGLRCYAAFIHCFPHIAYPLFLVAWLALSFSALRLDLKIDTGITNLRPRGSFIQNIFC